MKFIEKHQFLGSKSQKNHQKILKKPKKKNNNPININQLTLQLNFKN